MNGADLRAWRQAREITQADLAAALGCERKRVVRLESGGDLPPDVLQFMGVAPAPVVEKPDVAIKAALRVAEEGKPAAKQAPVAGVFDPVAAGLRPYPRSNTQFGASINFDRREVAAPWKRVAGCCRVVHESIPDPVPFYAPTWAGWRGVPTASGRVFDFETGHEMRDYNARAMAKPAAIAAAGAARPKGGADKPRRR